MRKIVPRVDSWGGRAVEAELCGSTAGQAAGGRTVTPVTQREISPPTGALIN